MSIKLMSLVFEAHLSTVAYLIPATDTRHESQGYLDAHDKAVLLALADRAEDDGTSIFPSIERLVNMTGLSESTVHRAMLHLKYTHPRMLTVEKKANRYSTTRHRIIVSALERVERWKFESGVSSRHLSVVRGVPQTVRGVQQTVRGVQQTPDSSVSHQVKQPSQSKTSHQENQATASGTSAVKKPAAEVPARMNGTTMLMLSRTPEPESPNSSILDDLFEPAFRDSGSSRERARERSVIDAEYALLPPEEED